MTVSRPALERLRRASNALAILITLWAAPAVAALDPLNGWWRVLRLAKEAIPAVSAGQYSVIFRDGQLSGKIACNGYWGGYSAKDAVLHIEIEGETTAGCISRRDPGLMDRGGAMLNLLTQTDSFRTEGETLILRSQGKDLIWLRPAPETDRLASAKNDKEKTVPILNSPQWTRRPLPQDVEGLVRKEALYEVRSTQMLCAVAPKGELKDCEIAYPRSMSAQAVGAAYALVEFYRLSPDDTRIARRHHASVLVDLTPPQPPP